MFYFDKINGKKVLKSSNLQGLQHFFTTRESVIKTKELECEKFVEENIKDVCKFLNISKSNLIHPTQTHTSFVDIAKIGVTNYHDTDGLILTNKEQAVFLNFADCTPLIFYDEKNNIAAVSHAGWRGTAGSIAVNTVEKMSKEFNTNLKHLKVAIGPAISLCCYNVGEDVFSQLKSTVNDFSDLSKKVKDKLFVDLKMINKRQLTEYGLIDENIDVCEYCTVCNNDLFFSYRKENATTNRHSAVVKLI